MQFCRCLLLISIALLIQSCATTPRMTANYQWGKANFTSGNFKSAFRQLLPVAVNGNPEAQYAVGYMYYNGFGVSQDDESGIFWMERAAEQRYFPARQALFILSQRQPTCPDLVRKPEGILADYHYHDNFGPDVTTLCETKVEPKCPCVDRHDDVLQTIVKKPPCRVMPVMTSNEYALQLSGGYELIDIKDFQAQYGLQRKTHIWHTQHNGKDWYVLTYGRYHTVAEARYAEEHLPCSLRSLGPWVRKVCGLRIVK